MDTEYDTQTTDQPNAAANAPTSNDAERRRQQLEAELAQLEAQEQASRAEAAQRAQAERDAALPPDKRAVRDELVERAHEALEREWPQSWTPTKPEAGHPDELIGLVTRIDPRVGPSKTFGTYAAVVEVRTIDEQEWTVWANEDGALWSQLIRLRIQPGEIIAVRYRGLKPSKANPGQTYQDFRLVRVEDADGEPVQVDWEQIDRSRQDPAALPPAAEPPPQTGGDDDIPF